MGLVDKSSQPLRQPTSAQPPRPCIGLEAEFTLYIDDEKRLPEEVFGNPSNLVREAMIPRTGRSWHLPSGGALYFDTGVIELATPIIEIDAGCSVRATRSLWEQIRFLRQELDAWEHEHRVKVRLEGFSAHYSVSVPGSAAFSKERIEQTALLLTHLLHVPVMILGANRASTGVGVRPRTERLEVTLDFTPDPDLMVGLATLITGIVLRVSTWPDHRLDVLHERKIPLIAGFAPRAHTSRKGFLARSDCFPQNPFDSDPNQERWLLSDGRRLSLRQIAREIVEPFRSDIAGIGDAEAYAHLMAVLEKRARSLLDFSERPANYSDVGRTIDWSRRTRRELPLSRYERVIERVLSKEPIQIGPFFYRPERMLSWYEITFRNCKTHQPRVFTLDELAWHCAI